MPIASKTAKASWTLHGQVANKDGFGADAGDEGVAQV
jgi:hypothetical protein